MSEEKNDEQVKGWRKLFTPEGLPILLQGILGFSSLFYITGYLCWSIYAIANHLGFLPALREQYFVAGVIPVSLSIAVFIGLFGHWPFTNRLNKRYKVKIEKYRKKYLLTLAIAFSVFLLILLLVFLVPQTFNLNEIISLSIVYAGLYCFYFCMSILDPNPAYFIKIIVSIIFFALFSLLLAIYIVFLFPILPRELGGPAETRVQLDLVREDISPQTLALVSDSVSRAYSSKVIRTHPLFLIFDGGDLVLLKQKTGKIDSANTLLKIKREVIQGLFNCN